MEEWWVNYLYRISVREAVLWNAGRLSRRIDGCQDGDVIGGLRCAKTNQTRGDCQVHAYCASSAKIAPILASYFI